VAVEPLPQERETTRSIGAILDRLNRSIGLARPDALRALSDGWVVLVGRAMAEQTELESLHDGVMTIAVTDPAVAESLRWQSADLVAAANELSGAGTVVRLAIRVRPNRS
jgi:hypothetical protein